MAKHRHGRKPGHALKIPESVDKTVDEKPRKSIVDATADELLTALNKMINKHDLTFEEALYALDILQLSILAKYVDVRIDMKIDEIMKVKGIDKEGRMYA